VEPENAKITANDQNLLQAALEGDLTRVCVLISMGANVNVADAESFPLGLEWNITPLMCAAARGHLDILRALLAAGADVSAATKAHKVDGGGGSQALHYALKRRQVDAARLLLDAGADPNAVGNSASVPLTCALEQMDLEAVRLMLERGARANLIVKRKEYHPPLYRAASVITNTSSMVLREGNLVFEVAEIWERRDEVIEIFRLLIEAGADPNAPGPRQSTALECVVLCTKMPDDLRLPSIELLMDAGARPDQADRDGHTPMSLAKQFPHPRVIDLLSRSSERREPDQQEARPSSQSEASGPTNNRSVGTSDFLKLMSTGEPEWALFVIKAPIEQTSKALAAFLQTTRVRSNVQIVSAANETDDVANAVAIISVAANPWTVVYLSLFYANRVSVDRAIEAAKSLSSQLSARAIAYVAESSSDGAGILVFDVWESVDGGFQVSDEDEADRIFQDNDVYLPACYPKSKANQARLAVEMASANRVERADLVFL
jgi:ankyrin repeat protein